MRQTDYTGDGFHGRKHVISEASRDTSSFGRRIVSGRSSGGVAARAQPRGAEPVRGGADGLACGGVQVQGHGVERGPRADDRWDQRALRENTGDQEYLAENATEPDSRLQRRLRD